MRLRSSWAAIPALAAVALLTFGSDSRAETGGVTLTLEPGVTGNPGQQGVDVSGTITNLYAFPVHYNNDGAFVILSGPSGYNSSSITLDTITNPFLVTPPTNLGSIADIQSDNSFTGNLFDLNVDPSAPQGFYSGQYSLSYSATDPMATFYFDLTFPSTPTVPEPNSVTTLCAGLAGLGLLLFRARKMARNIS